jgi:NifU-like protein involved in Fe-S cluster formation
MYLFLSTASSSLASEWIKGKNIDEAGKIKNSDIAKVPVPGTT